MPEVSTPVLSSYVSHPIIFWLGFELQSVEMKRVPLDREHSNKSNFPLTLLDCHSSRSPDAFKMGPFLVLISLFSESL